MLIEVVSIMMRGRRQCRRFRNCGNALSDVVLHAGCYYSSWANVVEDSKSVVSFEIFNNVAVYVSADEVLYFPIMLECSSCDLAFCQL